VLVITVTNFPYACIILLLTYKKQLLTVLLYVYVILLFIHVYYLRVNLKHIVCFHKMKTLKKCI